MYISSTITALTSPFLSKNDTGLGNVLFQIASVCGIAKLLNTKVTFPHLSMLCDKLENNYDLNHRHTIYRNIPMHSIPMGFQTVESHTGTKTYDDELVATIARNINTNWMIKGHLETHTIFPPPYPR